MSPASPRGTAWQASVRPSGSGADWDNAVRWFATWNEVDWAEYFDRNPDVQMRILGDIYREVKKVEAKRRGERAVVSRRRAVGRAQGDLNGSLDELHDMLTPRLSMDPFPQAILPLIEESRGVRALARRSRMSHSTILRMMNGDMPLEMYRLVALAQGAGVAPAYFKEWREAHVLTAMAAMLASNPNLSVKFSRALTAAQNGR